MKSYMYIYKNFNAVSAIQVKQGHTQNLMWVGSFQDLFDFDMVQVCKKLGGLRACPPGKF